MEKMATARLLDYEKNTSEDIIAQLNVKNAKRIAICLVIGFTIYHGILHLKYGMDSCTLLLDDGRYKGNSQWQPYGCMIHNYNKIDTKRCFKLLQFVGHENHIAFIGDSRLLQLYGAFVRTLSDNVILKENIDQNFRDNHLGLNIEYIFSPFLSSSNDKKLNIIDKFVEWKSSKTYPKFIVIGYGVEDILYSNGSSLTFEQFQYNLTKLISIVDDFSAKNSIILWNLQEPVNSQSQPFWKNVVNNSVIDMYNEGSINILKHSSMKIFHTNPKLSEPFIEEMKDGSHLFSHHVAKKSAAQVILNIYCNDHMNFNDGSCCTSTEQYTTLQVVTFSILLLCLVLAVVMVIFSKCVQWRKNTLVDNYTQSDVTIFISALAKLALIMFYFYVCDRTNFFMKETKYYSTTSFWLPVVYIFCVGLFFTEDSRCSKVLHRHQTDEWKGWMQLVILIYHWTDAIEILPLYMHIRVLVSAYLFLSGYGHFYYMWQRGDGGIVRFFQILFRYNFMTVVLCLCMNRPYQFYYYVPVVSFWFMVVYLVLVIPPHVTAVSSDQNPIQYSYLVFKFVLLFTVITVFYMSEVFFEKVFVTRPWKALFVTTDDDIYQWWFRWKLDRYSVSYGMVYCAGFFLAQRYNLLDDNNHNNLFSNGVSLSATLLAFIGIASYTTFTFLCKFKSDCIEVHTYIVFIPILSYIILRNISGVLRTRFSSFFAWFGRISLELFIGQYHIWLAADSHGVLVLAPRYTNLNAFITSFIFVCASHEIHQITKILLPYAVPNDRYSVIRNVLLFIAVLVPIGIHDGMF